MKIFEFLATVNFLIAGAAGNDNLATAFFLVVASFACGWLAIPKKKTRKKII